ncbi:MAG: hypothetical protein H6641_25310 [Caldilineaceae bacterium]|nr:hypothetical protein [Caldilineaceae bacterium]
MVAAITAKPDSALVFPTGGTPLGLYEELIRRYQQGAFDPSHLRIFLLDEYVGIGAEDERALLGWLQHTLFEPLQIQPAQITPLPGNAPDLRPPAANLTKQYRMPAGWIWPFWALGPMATWATTNRLPTLRRPRACSS